MVWFQASSMGTWAPLVSGSERKSGTDIQSPHSSLGVCMPSRKGKAEPKMSRVGSNRDLVQSTREVGEEKGLLSRSVRAVAPLGEGFPQGDL